MEGALFACPRPARRPSVVHRGGVHALAVWAGAHGGAGLCPARSTLLRPAQPNPTRCGELRDGLKAIPGDRLGQQPPPQLVALCQQPRCWPAAGLPLSASPPGTQPRRHCVRALQFSFCLSASLYLFLSLSLLLPPSLSLPPSLPFCPSLPLSLSPSLPLPSPPSLHLPFRAPVPPSRPPFCYIFRGPPSLWPFTERERPLGAQRGPAATQPGFQWQAGGPTSCLAGPARAAGRPRPLEPVAGEADGFQLHAGGPAAPVGMADATAKAVTAAALAARASGHVTRRPPGYTRPHRQNSQPAMASDGSKAQLCRILSGTSGSGVDQGGPVAAVEANRRLRGAGRTGPCRGRGGRGGRGDGCTAPVGAGGEEVALQHGAASLRRADSGGIETEGLRRRD